MVAKAQGVATGVAVAVPKVRAATRAKVVEVSKRLVHKEPVVHKVKVGKGPDGAVHRLVTRNPTAMKAVLPVVPWASRVLPVLHPVDNLTPCAPASI